MRSLREEATVSQTRDELEQVRRELREAEALQETMKDLDYMTQLPVRQKVMRLSKRFRQLRLQEKILILRAEILPPVLDPWMTSDDA